MYVPSSSFLIALILNHLFTLTLILGWLDGKRVWLFLSQYGIALFARPAWLVWTWHFKVSTLPTSTDLDEASVLLKTGTVGYKRNTLEEMETKSMALIYHCYLPFSFLYYSGKHEDNKQASAIFRGTKEWRIRAALRNLRTTPQKIPKRKNRYPMGTCVYSVLEDRRF